MIDTPFLKLTLPLFAALFSVLGAEAVAAREAAEAPAGIVRDAQPADIREVA